MSKRVEPQQRCLREIQLQADVGLFWYSHIGRLYTTDWESNLHFVITRVDAERAHVSADGTAFCLDLVIGMRYGAFKGEASSRQLTQPVLLPSEYRLVGAEDAEVVVELKASIEKAYGATTQLNLYGSRLEQIAPMQREFVLCYPPPPHVLRDRVGEEGPLFGSTMELDVCTAARLAGQTVWRWPEKCWGRSAKGVSGPIRPVTLCRDDSCDDWLRHSRTVNDGADDSALETLNYSDSYPFATDQTPWRLAFDRLHELDRDERPLASCLHQLLRYNALTTYAHYEAANV